MINRDRLVDVKYNITPGILPGVEYAVIEICFGARFSPLRRQRYRRYCESPEANVDFNTLLSH